MSSIRRMGGDLPNKTKAESFKEFSLTVSKNGKDVTPAFINQVESLLKISPYIPLKVTSEFAYSLNAILNLFTNVTTQQILESQFYMSMRSKTGKEAYLTLVDSFPFIAFEDAPSLLLPLGDNERTVMLLDSNRVEQSMFAEGLQNWSFQPVPSPTVSGQMLLQRYEDLKVELTYEEDMRVSLEDGLLISEGSRRRTFYSGGDYRMGREFSWVTG